MPPPERPASTPQPASYRYHAIAIVLAAAVTFVLAELLDIEDCKCALDHWAESPEAMAALTNWRPDGVLCDFETMDYSTGSWPPARPDADFPAAPRTCGSLRGPAAVWSMRRAVWTMLRMRVWRRPSRCLASSAAEKAPSARRADQYET